MKISRRTVRHRSIDIVQVVAYECERWDRNSFSYWLISHATASSLLVNQPLSQSPSQMSPKSLLGVETLEVKVLPCDPPILELTANLPHSIPCKYTDVDHTTYIALFGSGRKVGGWPGRWIHCQREGDQMLHVGDAAGCGTPS